MTGPYAVVSGDNRWTLAVLEQWEAAVARKRQAEREHPAHHWEIVPAGKRDR